MAPAVENWRISLQQSFITRMPLLTATNAFGIGRKCRVLVADVTCVISTPSIPTEIEWKTLTVWFEL